MKTVALLIFLGFSQVLSAQFVAKLRLVDSVPGLCDQNNVYALSIAFGKNQIEAACGFTNAQLQARLNTELQFLKDNPKFKGNGMVSIIINCKGEMVQCKTDISSRNNTLDLEILAIFKSLLKWSPGTLDGAAVDSNILFSYKIKKGKIILEG